MPIPDSTLVIGHRNPDMDAIASAIGYAWLLGAVVPTTQYVPGRTGQVNTQTAFALDYFALEAPMLVTDVRPRVIDLSEDIPPLTRASSVLEACQSIARTLRPTPLLDTDSKPLGLLTGAGLFAHFAEALSSASVLQLAKEFELHAEAAIDPHCVTLQGDEFVRDLIGQIIRSEQDDFIVTDSDGRYAGLVRKSALMSPPHRRVIMVDHNEAAQAVPGLEEAEVVEVLDHHRLSTIPTAVPIRFHVDPVGSCSTLVLERSLEFGQSFPAGVAGVLISGILSDTLIFRSPTTTPRDVIAARRLAKLAGLADADADDAATDAAINVFGEKLLGASAGLGSRLADEVVSGDIKYYDQGGLKVGIAQIEVSSFAELPDRLDDLRAALDHLVEAQKLALALLMITDVVRGNSRLVLVGQQRIIATLPYKRLDDDTLDAPGMMSRKKQLLPVVLAGLAQVM